MDRIRGQRASRLIGLVVWMAAGTLAGRAEPVATSAVIDHQLAPFHLAGTGNVFLSEGSKNGVDPRLIAAIAGAESTFGNHVCVAYNAWNWFWEGPCPKSPFDSWAGGIHTVSKFMALRYVLHGYETIEEIGGKYCADGCSHWVPNVTAFYLQMGGDAGNLQYAHAAPSAPPTTSPTPVRATQSPTPAPATPSPTPASAGVSYVLLVALGLLAGVVITVAVVLVLKTRLPTTSVH